jgi:hypothetical protein
VVVVWEGVDLANGSERELKQLTRPEDFSEAVGYVDNDKNSLFGNSLVLVLEYSILPRSSLVALG